MAPPVAGTRDLRKAEVWAQVQDYFHQLHGPAFGRLSNADDLTVSPDRKKIAFTGSIWEKLEGLPATRICVLDVNTAKVDVVTDGPNNDKLPQWSSDGGSLAFLSDREKKGTNQLYLLGQAKPICVMPGRVESFSWSPKGERFLLVVAEQEADTGSGDSQHGENPKWMPKVEAGTPGTTWRSAWIFETKSQKLTQTWRHHEPNTWEACWCGEDTVVAVVSDDPTESAWCGAALTLATFYLRTGESKIIYRPALDCQLALPVASASGNHLAVLEAPCSDRGITAGYVLLVDPLTGHSDILDTKGVDASYVAWLNEERVLYIGLRGFQTVAGSANIRSKSTTELWATDESCGSLNPKATPFSDTGFAVVLESHTRYPEIAIFDKGHPKTIVSFDHDGARWLRSQLGSVEEVSWKAPDGLDIHGLLFLPKSPQKPYPFVLHIHGGPIWAHQNKWEMNYTSMPLLVARGYAVLHPNPRGSTGRGRDFASKIIGDMCGVETHDFLSGVDAMVDRGIADPQRLGVAGSSYGGLMTSWLVTQTKRFKAAVAVAGVTDWYVQHTVSIIPDFDSAFLDRKPYAPDGLFFQRSPLFFVDRVSTPFLQITGEDDDGVPPVQSIQFHNALREHGVDSVVAEYPGEGHEIKHFPAYIDYSARMLNWFETYMPAQIA